ncbi:MAG: hypothetical protein IJ365_06640 [Clostridia bacterium]|nr:hypothetical protein [Clostridia bacterium]
MFFKKFSQKIFGFIIMGFVIGTFLAFILPPIVIAIIECILLGLLCWCYYWI